MQKEIISLEKIITAAKIIDETAPAVPAKKPVSKAKAAPKKTAASRDAPKKRGRKAKQ